MRIRVDYVVAAFVVGVPFRSADPVPVPASGASGALSLSVCCQQGHFCCCSGSIACSAGTREFMVEVLLVWMVVWESLNFLAYIRNR